jgi:hypothetical protein
MMYDASLCEILPTAADMRSIIDELYPAPNELRFAALGALEVILKLCPHKPNFLENC